MLIMNIQEGVNNVFVEYFQLAANTYKQILLIRLKEEK